ncbi:hypothetical protein [Lentzea nigeriaca]|uniref:hypothetical protein n=1 Tax=Lentzea nigeriaca TaxID=1128665 RepID=UPI001957F0FF|nr:hypothetical protein [Lentzea nigeriaca]MBM7863497.1 hypothetical protein [Lentzea nigeriaca]
MAIWTCSAFTGSLAWCPVSNSLLALTAFGRETSSIASVALARAPGSTTAVPSSPDTSTGPSSWNRMARSFAGERVHEG